MLLLLTAALLAAAPALTTVAEESGFARTGRYEEVVALCRAFPRRYPAKVRCEQFGLTPEGRPMLALIAQEGGALEPSAISRRGLPVVMAQGGIHAGEIDGKDAGFWVLRELLEGRAAPGALGKLAFLFVPVFNVDGHERFGPNHRPNQNGPGEMGWRVTAHNLNLNRDYAKAESPEMAAMLRLLGRYDPILHLDLHVTDGAKFQHQVAVMLEPSQAGAEALRPLGRALMQALLQRLTEQGYHPVDFYPSFEQDDDPSSGFSYGVAPPRFSQGYWMLRNRFAVLVETHSWKDYPTRVRATREVLLSALQLAAAKGKKWRLAAEEADRADLLRGGQQVALSFDNTDKKLEIEFLGYAYQREQSTVSGKAWVRYHEEQPQRWRVPYRPEVFPGLTARAPRGGYLVPVAHAGWLGEKLKLHGFRFQVLKKPLLQAAVETFRASQLSFSPTPSEGRMPVTVQGSWAGEKRDLPRGSLYVPIAQPGAALLVHLLEPLGPDSFFRWGFFNAHLEAKEYMEDYVTEEVARKMLELPEVRREFEEKLKDEKFAKSPEERLQFFYRRHPSYDERLNLYPVYRTEQQP